MALTRVLGSLAGAGAVASAACLGYASWEARQYTLRRATVPILPPGHSELKVLHITDLHMTPSQAAKRDWVSWLATLSPDLVVNTGDNLAHPDAVPTVLEAFDDLLPVPGVFVFGSNDYYAPTRRNPFRYLLPDNGVRHTSSPELPWPELQKGFTTAGWLDLTNDFGSLTVKDTRIAFAGVDDPHLRFDDLRLVAGPADPTADLRVAVTHAPYLRVLDQFTADGYDAIIAGHTHGGQVCLPYVGALATNCDLDKARAKGLHRHPASSSAGEPGSAWLHVSAGLGTNPYTPVRFACRPEATLLTFVPTAG